MFASSCSDSILPLEAFLNKTLEAKISSLFKKLAVLSANILLPTPTAIAAPKPKSSCFLSFLRLSLAILSFLDLTLANKDSPNSSIAIVISFY